MTYGYNQGWVEVQTNFGLCSLGLMFFFFFSLIIFNPFNSNVDIFGTKLVDMDIESN